MLHAYTETPDTPARLLAKLVRVVLAREAFETLADLTDALKTECARLKIRWTPHDISAAYALIASNRPLVTPITRIKRLEPIDDGRPLSRAEAAALWAQLTAQVSGGPDADRV